MAGSGTPSMEENVWRAGSMDKTPMRDESVDEYFNSTPQDNNAWGAKDDNAGGTSWAPGAGSSAYDTSSNSTPDYSGNSSSSTGASPYGSSGNSSDYTTTPMSSSESDGGTPNSGAGGGNNGTSGDHNSQPWLMERVHVTLISGETGIVENYNRRGMTASIRLPGGDLVTKHTQDITSAVVPVANDKVLVVSGNETGAEGALVCIDGTDAIFKDSAGNFKIVDVGDVTKVDEN